MQRQSGFTLIEALVAMAILAVAAGGLIGAAEINTRRVAGLEARAAAGWVAQNYLAELQLAGVDAAGGTHDRDMLGQQWRVETITATTDEPELTRVTILVYPRGDDAAMSTHTGFVDTGRAR